MKKIEMQDQKINLMMILMNFNSSIIYKNKIKERLLI